MARKPLTIDKKRALIRARLSQSIAAIGPDYRVTFHASNMAAGPCEIARAMGGKSMLAKEAPPPPFEGCDRPDQCGCLYGPDIDRLFQD